MAQIAAVLSQGPKDCEVTVENLQLLHSTQEQISHSRILYMNGHTQRPAAQMLPLSQDAFIEKDPATGIANPVPSPPSLAARAEQHLEGKKVLKVLFTGRFIPGRHWIL